MKSRPNFLPSLTARFALTFLTAVCTAPWAWSDSNQNDLAALGLVVHWQSNIGGAPLANGAKSYVIWPHTTAKREYVTVRSGNRVIERIRGEEVDREALDKALVAGEKPQTTPTLGLAGATKKAEKLVSTYKILGRKIEIDPPYSERLVYAVSLTSNGILETTDAETGSIIWRTESGKSSLPMFGPGVSDDYVAVTNGNNLYVYELATGNPVTSRSLQFTPTASPTVIAGKAIVPSVDGRLVAYDIKSHVAPLGIVRTGTENRLGTTVSPDQRFLSWPTGNRLVIARMDEVPQLWTSAKLNEPILGSAIATQSGFLGATDNGTVFHCSTLREDTLLWKTRLAVQVTQSPVANKDFAFIVSDEGFLYAIRLTDGSSLWSQQPKNIRYVVAVGKEHVYVKDSRNSLVAIGFATGMESGRSSAVLPTAIPNTVNDRLFFVTSQGQVTCLRELNAAIPTFSTSLNGAAVAPVAEQPKTDEQPKTQEQEEANPFGTDGPDPFNSPSE